jgi:hypothetical protein
MILAGEYLAKASRAHLKSMSDVISSVSKLLDPLRPILEVLEPNYPRKTIIHDRVAYSSFQWIARFKKAFVYLFPDRRSELDILETYHRSSLEGFCSFLDENNHKETATFIATAIFGLT